jgi:capsular exopolysaccharide synthesis family protein
VVRTNVRFAWASPEPIALLVTSPGVGEGKSTVSSNLAASFAQSGKRTILVDTDLRHPALHRLLRVEQDGGLTALLAGYDSGGSHRNWIEEWVGELLVDTWVPNLRLLPAGSALGVNAGELVASPMMAHVLDFLSRSADVIVLDSPPVLPLADVAILSSLPLGVVLVVEADRTTMRDVSLAYEVLVRSQARVLGCVLNKASMRTAPYYQYGTDHAKSTSLRSSPRPLRRA